MKSTILLFGTLSDATLTHSSHTRSDDPTLDESTRLRNRIAELESLVRELRGTYIQSRCGMLLIIRQASHILAGQRPTSATATQMKSGTPGPQNASPSSAAQTANPSRRSHLSLSPHRQPPGRGTRSSVQSRQNPLLTPPTPIYTASHLPLDLLCVTTLSSRTCAAVGTLALPLIMADPPTTAQQHQACLTLRPTRPMPAIIQIQPPHRLRRRMPTGPVPRRTGAILTMGTAPVAPIMNNSPTPLPSHITIAAVDPTRHWVSPT